MKKAIIAVFSVSLTAGTLYLTYSQVKSFLIKKLVDLWQGEAKHKNKELSEDQLSYLKKELDKLYAWEIKRLSSYTGKVLAKAPEKELAPLIEKLKEKKILERADLKAVDVLLFGT